MGTGANSTIARRFWPFPTTRATTVANVIKIVEYQYRIFIVTG
jgi:hypothetical protein